MISPTRPMIAVSHILAPWRGRVRSASRAGLVGITASAVPPTQNASVRTVAQPHGHSQRPAQRKRIAPAMMTPIVSRNSQRITPRVVAAEFVPRVLVVILPPSSLLVLTHVDPVPVIFVEILGHVPPHRHI